MTILWRIILSDLKQIIFDSETSVNIASLQEEWSHYINQLFISNTDTFI